MTKREAEINERRLVKFQEDKLFAFRVNLDHILRNPEHESKLKEWLPDKATIRALVNPHKRKPPPPPDPDLPTTLKSSHPANLPSDQVWSAAADVPRFRVGNPSICPYPNIRPTGSVSDS